MAWSSLSCTFLMSCPARASSPFFIASAASWALRYAASLEGVITVLSGMSNVEQMEDNLSFMENFQPLSEDERKVVDNAVAALNAIPHIPCTACQYCVKGCPMEIAIPGIFKAMNSYLIYNNLPGARGNYGFETRLGGVASKCIACRQCEEVCPQHIAIVDELARVAEILEKK